jgi:hypothetical protein
MATTGSSDGEQASQIYAQTYIGVLATARFAAILMCASCGADDYLTNNFVYWP